MPVVSYFIQPYQFPTGRLIFALQATKERAEDLSLPDIATACGRALHHASETLRAERDYVRGRSRSKRMAEAKKLTPAIARQLSLIRDLLEAHVRAFDGDEAMREPVATMLAELFPAGVKAISAQPYVETLSTLECLIVSAKAFDDLIDALSLRRAFEKLVELTANYGAAIRAFEEPTVDYATVKAHREVSHRLLVEIIARVVGRFPTSSEADRAACEALLEVIVEQNEAVRAERRQRKAVAKPEVGAQGDPLPLAGVAAGPE